MPLLMLLNLHNYYWIEIGVNEKIKIHPLFDGISLPDTFYRICSISGRFFIHSHVSSLEYYFTHGIRRAEKFLSPGSG